MGEDRRGCWVRGGILPGRRDGTGHFYRRSENLLENLAVPTPGGGLADSRTLSDYLYVRLDALEPVIRLNQLMPDVSEDLAAISDDEIDAEIQAVRTVRRGAPETE